LDQFDEMFSVSDRDVKSGVDFIPDAGAVVIPFPAGVGDVKDFVVIEVEVRFGDDSECFIVVLLPEVPVIVLRER